MTAEEIKHLENKMDDLMRRISSLSEDLEEIVRKYSRVQEENCEEAFAIYINNGFTVGVKFQVEGKGVIYTITGINNYGFVVEGEPNGERRKYTLYANKKDAETHVKRLVIVKEGDQA